MNEIKIDPRPDLKRDTEVWEVLLRCASLLEDGTVYGILHGFRCGGAFFLIEGNKFTFKMAKEWTEEQKKEYRDKYIIPHKDTIKSLVSFCEEWFSKTKKETQQELFI